MSSVRRRRRGGVSLLLLTIGLGLLTTARITPFESVVQADVDRVPCDFTAFQAKLEGLFRENILSDRWEPRLFSGNESAYSKVFPSEEKESSSLPSEYAALPQDGTLYVIGDVHGDLLQLMWTLTQARITNAEGYLVFPDDKPVWVIFLGDIMDRGPDSPLIAIYVDHLKHQAEIASNGSKVITLLGNHEAMLLLGWNRYVSQEELDKYWKGDRQLNLQAYKKGTFLHQYLTTKWQISVAVEDMLFSHAGIHPDSIREYRTVSDLNVDIMNDLSGKNDSPRRPKALSNQGVLFWRGPAHGGKDACEMLYRSLDKFNRSVLFNGHTVTQSQEIEMRCNGRYLMCDTNISRAMNVRALHTPSIVSIHCSQAGDRVVRQIKVPSYDDKDKRSPLPNVKLLKLQKGVCPRTERPKEDLLLL